MKCPICNHELNQNLECENCLFVASIIPIEKIISLYKKTKELKSTYESFLEDKSKNILYYQNRYQSFDSNDLKKLEIDIKDGEKLSNTITLLLNDGKALWPLFKDDTRNISNVHYCLALISEIENDFTTNFYSKISDVIEKLKSIN